MEYQEEWIANINDFKKAHKKEDLDNGNIKFRPGKTQIRDRVCRMNPSFVPLDTMEEFRTQKQRALRGRGILYGPLAVEKGFKVAIQAMNEKKTRYLSIKLEEKTQNKKRVYKKRASQDSAKIEERTENN